MTDAERPMTIETLDRYLTVANERIAVLTAQRDELRTCLQEMLDGFEAGVFVRNIKGDGKRDWALHLMPFVRTLGKAQAAIARGQDTALCATRSEV